MLSVESGSGKCEVTAEKQLSVNVAASFTSLRDHKGVCVVCVREFYKDVVYVAPLKVTSSEVHIYLIT